MGVTEITGSEKRRLLQRSGHQPLSLLSKYSPSCSGLDKPGRKPHNTRKTELCTLETDGQRIWGSGMQGSGGRGRAGLTWRDHACSWLGSCQGEKETRAAVVRSNHEVAPQHLLVPDFPQPALSQAQTRIGGCQTLGGVQLCQQ